MPTYTEVTTDVKAPWRDASACEAAIEENPMLINAWVAENSPRRAEAEAICADCPVQMFCLRDAVDDENSYGLRGGYFFDRGALATAEYRLLGKTLGIQARKRQKTRALSAAKSADLEATVIEDEEILESELVEAVLVEDELEYA